MGPVGHFQQLDHWKVNILDKLEPLYPLGYFYLKFSKMTSNIGRKLYRKIAVNKIWWTAHVATGTMDVRVV